MWVGPDCCSGCFGIPSFFARGSRLGWALISVNNEGYQGPPERPESNIVASVTLAVLDGENGVVRVLTADSSTEVRVYGPGEGSFLRGVIRTLVRERAAEISEVRRPSI